MVSWKEPENNLLSRQRSNSPSNSPIIVNFVVRVDSWVGV